MDGDFFGAILGGPLVLYGLGLIASVFGAATGTPSDDGLIARFFQWAIENKLKAIILSIIVFYIYTLTPNW